MIISAAERTRRQDAVRYCKTLRDAARELDLTEITLRKWVQRNLRTELWRLKQQHKPKPKVENKRKGRNSVKMTDALDENGCEIVRGLFKWLLRAKERCDKPDVREVMKAYRQYMSGR